MSKGSEEGDLFETSLGPFQLLSEHDRGATGRIFLARDQRSGASVVVKRPVRSDAVDYGILRREASVLARLGRAGHPGVVRVLETGIDQQGAPWYAMEHVVGTRLDEIAIRRAGTGRLPYVLGLVRRLADTLAFLHGEGTVHGDLSPRNVLVQLDGRLVLVDFGTALVLQAGDEPRDVAQVDGQWWGTPGYIAPERLRGYPIDARADLYALGCILFELVAGRRPFLSDDVRALNDQHLFLAPLAPSRIVAEVPPELDTLILRLLAKDPRERVSHADEVVQMLARLCGDPSPHATHTRPLYRPSFVGRRQEIDVLHQSLRDTTAGRGGVVFIVGASGIGKTRLLNHLSRLAISLGVHVVIGQAGRGERLGPSGAKVAAAPLEVFRPLLEWVTDRCATPAGAALAAELRPHLDLLLPFGGSGASRASEPEAAPSAEIGRQRVLAALRSVLERCALDRPLLLCLDDLQWADEMTHTFLASPMIDELTNKRLLLVCAQRPPEETPATTLTTSRRRVLELRSLTDDDVSEMIKDMLGTSMPPKAVTELLVRCSEGNPFFVSEYLRALVDKELLRPMEPRRWRVDDTVVPLADLAGTGMPRSLRDLMRVRFAGISDEAAHLVDLASVMGREFDSRWLVAAYGSIWREGAVDELMRREILESRHPGRFRFVHDRLREAREEGLGPDQRRELHRQAALALTTLAGAPDAGNERFDAIIGTHWANAEEPARALPHLERAAQDAKKVYAIDRTVDLLRLAVVQASARSGAPDRVAIVAEELADLLVQTGAHDEAGVNYRLAMRATPVEERLRLARLQRKIGSSRWTVHDYAAADQALAAAETQLGEASELRSHAEKQEWIEIQQSRFSVRYFAGQTGEETERLLAKLQPVVEQEGTPLQRVMFWVRMTSDALSRIGFGFSPIAVALARRGMVEWERAAEPSLESAQAHFAVGFALLMGGRLHVAEATAALRRATTEAAKLSERILQSRTLAYLTIATRFAGNIDASAELAGELRRLCEATQMRPYLGVASACRGWCAWRRGNLDAAASDANEARAWWFDQGTYQFPFRWLANLVLIDVCRVREQPAGALPLVADLMRSDHQRLPDGLERAARATLASDPAGDPCATLACLDGLVSTARELGFL